MFKKSKKMLWISLGLLVISQIGLGADDRWQKPQSDDVYVTQVKTKLINKSTKFRVWFYANQVSLNRGGAPYNKVDISKNWLLESNGVEWQGGEGTKSSYAIDGKVYIHYLDINQPLTSVSNTPAITLNLDGKSEEKTAGPFKIQVEARPAKIFYSAKGSGEWTYQFYDYIITVSDK